MYCESTGSCTSSAAPKRPWADKKPGQLQELASSFSKAVEKIQMTGSVTQRDLQEPNDPGGSHPSQTPQSPSNGSLKWWVWGKGRRARFLLKEITVWDMHTRMSTSHVDLISAAFSVPPSYPARLHQPVNTLRRPTHRGPSNALGGSAMARPVTPGPLRA